MTECCNSYGKCTQGFNCPAREKTRSEFTANQMLFKPESPPNYMPKYDDPPMGRFEDFCEFVSLTWRPVFFGFFCAIALILWLALG